MNSAHPGFPVEIVDEAEGEVLIFDESELLDAFDQAQREGQEFVDTRIRRRYLELRDQLLTITSELDLLLAA